jgi:aminoglycoside 6'-N-acetyltransferase
MEAPRLQGERVVLRAMTSGDVVRVAEIHLFPDVTRWWPPRDADYLSAKLERDDVACWVVQLDDEVIGFAQAYEETNPEYRHAGMDLFLAPASHGRGPGRDVVRAIARHLLEDRGHHRVVIDPAAANARALRCYEAVGFRRAGTLRSYRWDHIEERWADGVLLELLAGELG